MARPKGKTTKTIDSLWKENENILKEAGYDYTTFRNNMISLSKTNTTPKGKPSVSRAWDAFKHKEEFVSKAERGAENIWAALNGQGVLKTVRKDVFGWRTSKDEFKSKMIWNKDDNMYEYTDKKGNVWYFELISGPHGSNYWRWGKK